MRPCARRLGVPDRRPRQPRTADSRDPPASLSAAAPDSPGQQTAETHPPPCLWPPQTAPDSGQPRSTCVPVCGRPGQPRTADSRDPPASLSEAAARRPCV
eukprot:317137-Chlamydomonas_euryale.AAC.1